ncbi:MAG: hypothetical protein ABR616_19195 [Dermatophilaceae bacterium]|nr:hypothetical protein [Intrasporangiaceae bacterium]
MGVIRDLWDLLAPVAPDRVRNWGEAVSDKADANDTALSGKADSPHTLGGSSHSADTLANLNAKVSDATLDTNTASRSPTTHASSHQPGGSDAMSVDAVAGTGSLRTLGTGSTQAAAGNDARLSDTRDPNAHALGGSAHSADTLANLNSKVSDATLDTNTASRPPTAHTLGGSAHSADTLANLNAKVSDATLIDTGDSRLSDTRDPKAHTLGGAAHSADTLANLNAKLSDATLDTNTASRPPTTHSHTISRTDETYIRPTLQHYREYAYDNGTLSSATIYFNATHANGQNTVLSRRSGALTVYWSLIPSATSFLIPVTLILDSTVTSVTWPSGTKFVGGAAPELDGETWISIVGYRGFVYVGVAWAGVAA